MSKIGSSYQGEIKALKIASENLLSISKNRYFTKEHIMSDCISALKSVSSFKVHTSHQSDIDSFLHNVSLLQEKGISTKTHWVPGHINLKGNELADKHAK